MIARGSGTLVVTRRPTNIGTSLQPYLYLPCPTCLTFLHRDTLQLHGRRCPLRTDGVNSTIDKINIFQAALLLVKPLLPSPTTPCKVNSSQSDEKDVLQDLDDDDNVMQGVSDDTLAAESERISLLCVQMFHGADCFGPSTMLYRFQELVKFDSEVRSNILICVNKSFVFIHITWPLIENLLTCNTLNFNLSFDQCVDCPPDQHASYLLKSCEAYMLLSQILIGCSTLSQENCKLIGSYLNNEEATSYMNGHYFSEVNKSQYHPRFISLFAYLPIVDTEEINESLVSGSDEQTLDIQSKRSISE